MACFRTLAAELPIKAPRPLSVMTLNTGLHFDADTRVLVWASKEINGTLSARWWNSFDDCLVHVELTALAAIDCSCKSTGSIVIDDIIHFYIWRP